MRNLAWFTSGATIISSVYLAMLGMKEMSLCLFILGSVCIATRIWIEGKEKKKK